MNLRQAYDGWAQQEQNRQLYGKTRDAFRKAWFTLPMNRPCSWYTRERLGLALAETRVIESMKVNAASIMVHVLTWANFAEPKWNPKPDFTMNDLTAYTRMTAEELEQARQKLNDGLAPTTGAPKRDVCDGCVNVKGCLTCKDGDQYESEHTADAQPEQTANAQTEQTAEDTASAPQDDKPQNDNNMEQARPRGKQPRKVCQIDTETLQVINTFDSMTAAAKAVGVKNLDRAVKRLQKAGGYYWSYPEDADSFVSRLSDKDAVLTAHVKDAGKPSAAKPKTVSPQTSPVAHQPSKALADYTDDELLEELDRRGWQGELSRRQIVTIGIKD